MNYQNSQIKTYKIIFLLIILLINSSSSTPLVFSSEFTDQFFTVDVSQGWQLFDQSLGSYQPYTQSTVCGTNSLLGGYNSLGSNSMLKKIFQNLPPHYELQIQFNIYFLDNCNLPLDNVYVVMDEQDEGSFSSTTAISNHQICGLQDNDRIWKYSNIISHSNPTLTLKLYDEFDLSKDKQSWGIRDVSLTITGQCHLSCSKCSGSQSNQCTACPDGSQPSSGVCVSNNTDGSNSGDGANGSAGDQTGISQWSVCDHQINDNAQYLMYSKQSQIVKDPTTFEQTVIIDVRINFSNTNISNDCKAQIVNNVYYQNQLTEMQAFPSELITLDQVTYTLKIQFNLNDAKVYARTSSIQNNNVVYSIYIIILNGNSKQMVRDHKFELFIINQGTETLNYLMDVNQIETSSDCTEDCFAIVDVPIEGQVCQVSDCSLYYSNTQKIVVQIGTYLITRFRFKDRSYQQPLNLKQVLFKGDNQVFDVTRLTSVLLNDNKGTIILQTFLIEPCQSAVFQYNLQIGSGSRLLQLNTNQISSAEMQTSQPKQLNDQQIIQLKMKIIKGTDDAQTVQTNGLNLQLSLQFIGLIIMGLLF